MHFVAEGVDGVDDVVVAVEVELSGGVGGIEHVHRIDACRWVDGEQALTHHFDFRHAYGGGKCRELTVDVGGGYVVEVDDVEVSDTGTHERLGNPAAYASHAEYYNARLVEPCYGFIAKKQSRAAFPLLCFDSIHDNKDSIFIVILT